MANSVSDEELAKKVQLGDREAFTELFHRFEQKILQYGKRFLYSYTDVEDAVQEVFLKAYIHIESFDTERKFSTWLYRIAHNTFINIIKKKGREPVSFFDFDTFLQFKIPSNLPSLEEIVGTNADFARATELIGKLSPKYREPIILFYQEDKTYEEIADIMHIPVATVGVRLKRGRDLIKKSFDTKIV